MEQKLTLWGNDIQLIDEGMGGYHFYLAETSDIRRGRRPSWISVGEAEQSDNRLSSNLLTVLSTN